VVVAVVRRRPHRNQSKQKQTRRPVLRQRWLACCVVRGLSCIILDTCSHDANWKSCDRNLLSFLKTFEAKLHSDRGWLATEGEEVRKVEVHTLHVTIVSLTVSRIHQAMLMTTRADTSDLAMLR
jgi:hypothetical protein